MADQDHGAGVIPQRTFGRTGAKVSALGLGGHHLGDLRTVDEVVRLVHEAVDAGVTFFDPSVDAVPRCRASVVCISVYTIMAGCSLQGKSGFPTEPRFKPT